MYFDDDKLLDKLAKKSQHCQTIEKACGQIETRDYWKDLSYRRKQGYISVHLEDYLSQLFRDSL